DFACQGSHGVLSRAHDPERLRCPDWCPSGPTHGAFLSPCSATFFLKPSLSPSIAPLLAPRAPPSADSPTTLAMPLLMAFISVRERCSMMSSSEYGSPSGPAERTVSVSIGPWRL